MFGNGHDHECDGWDEPMDVSPELQQLATSLAASAARNTAQMVVDRVRAVKTSNKSDETIAQLEQMITELISDKNDLVRIAQAYQAELVAQRLNPGEMQYIASTIVPLIQEVADRSPDADAAKTAQLVELLQPLLSVDTVNILQLLGFNFRKAIGEPLTALAAKAISSRAAPDANALAELQRLQHEKEIAYVELASDPEAFARWKELYGK